MGEGVFWSEREQRVYWVDIQGKRLHRFDPASGTNETRSLDKQVGTAVERAEGGLVLGLDDGVAGYDFDSEELDYWCDPMEGDGSNRLNDGKAGPDGRFYVGGIGEAGTQKLYCIDRDRSWRVAVEGVTCSNGLAWSLDHRLMYYIDTPTMQVVAYDFDKDSGQLSGKRKVVEVEERYGMPDGMTLDSEGKLWVAHWMGNAVRRWDPDTGELLDEIAVPAARVTSCAFGGPEYKDLYITTASVGFAEEDWVMQPQAGGLFHVPLEVAGIPNFSFGRAV